MRNIYNTINKKEEQIFRLKKFKKSTRF